MKRNLRAKPTRCLTAAPAMLVIVVCMIVLVRSARAADPTCDQFKSRLVEAGNVLQQAGLSPPLISYVQQMDMGPLKVFEVPIAKGDADLYCRDGRFDSFDVLLFFPDDTNVVLQFRYLVAAAIMAFTQQEAGEALKSLDKLVADVNANRDANVVLDSRAVIHLYGGDRLNFQINAADALYGTSPGKE